ncbi:MAG TPA: hypothetical protein VH352_18615 [Pseudonocardiaceae bacterium]|nr:hypothetical protein [Pseudonocardiaceae bacterium]
MRLGPLVRLLAGVAVVSTLVIGLLMAHQPAQGAQQNQGPASTPVPTAVRAAAAEVRPLVFHIARTAGQGLNVLRCARSGCGRVGWVNEGGSFTVTCSSVGDAVHGDTTWLYGDVHGQSGYVALYNLDATGGASATTMVPACATG